MKDPKIEFLFNKSVQHIYGGDLVTGVGLVDTITGEESTLDVSGLFIAIGAVAAVPFKDPSVTVLGVVLVCVATLASSLKPVVGELLMTASQKPKLAPAGAPQRRTCRAPGRRRLVCGAPLPFAHPPCVLSPRAQLWSSTTRASRSSS